MTININNYEILHPCCNLKVHHHGDDVTVTSGCDGSVLFEGPIAEFVCEFGNEMIWQVDMPDQDGYYNPILIRDMLGGITNAC